MGLKDKLKNIQKQKKGRREEDLIDPGQASLENFSQGIPNGETEKDRQISTTEAAANDSNKIEDKNSENNEQNSAEDPHLLGMAKELPAKKSGRFHPISRAKLAGPRVTLRCIEKIDLEHLLRWVGKNPLINKIGIPLPIAKEDLSQWITHHVNEDPNDRALYIIEQEDNIPIGLCGLFNIENSARRAEYSILIGDANYLGSNYGTECTNLILNLAFNLLNLNRVESFILYEDERAIRSFSKNGFNKEGELYEYTYIDGEYKNVIFLSILKKEYEETG